jgi:MFS family permease
MPEPAEDRPAHRTWSAVGKSREFQRLWAGTLVTLLGDQLARVALLVLVYARTGSAPAAAASYAVTLLPAMLGGPTLARLADRFPRRSVMVCCDLASAAVTTAMALTAVPVPALFVLAFAVGVVGAPFEAGRAATLAVLFSGHQERYAVAQTVMGLTVRASQILGFAGGGVIVEALGAHTSLLIDAATFLVSAVITRTGLTHRPAARTDQGTGQWADLKAGLRLVFGNPDLRTPALYGWLASFYIAPSAVVVPLVAQHGGGPVAVGALLSAPIAGAALCMTVFGRPLRDPANRHRLLAPLAALNGATLALSAFRPGLAGTALLWAVAGIGSGYQLIANVWFMTAVPNERRGQAFGLVSAGLLAGQGAGALAAGTLASHLDPAFVVAIFGAAGAVSAVVLALAIPRANGNANDRSGWTK